jgi:hypothetical protein
MKKTFIMAAVAAGMLTLATGTYAHGAEISPTEGAAVKTMNSDIVVMPGTGSDTLRLRFSGADLLHQEFHGGLTVYEASGGRMHYRPEAYQLINGKRRSVEVHFQIEGKDQATVRFGKADRNAPVILERGAFMFQPAWM